MWISATRATPGPSIGRALGIKGDNRVFSVQERESLLAVKGIGPIVIQRPEQIRFSSLQELAKAAIGLVKSRQ